MKKHGVCCICISFIACLLSIPLISAEEARQRYQLRSEPITVSEEDAMIHLNWKL